VEIFGELIGCLKFRKVALQYARRFGPAKEFDKRVVLLRTRAEFEEIVADYLEWRRQFTDERGELRPHYAPRPLDLLLPVPAGPNELW